MAPVSTTRLNVLRVFYSIAFVAGVLQYWPRLFRPEHALGVYDGAAFSFWAALMALFGLGIQFPLQMVPLIVLQLFYKVLWLAAVAVPLYSSGHWDDNAVKTTRLFIAIIVLDAAVIPWRHLLAWFDAKRETATAI